MYKPNLPFNTPFFVYTSTTTKLKGVVKKTYVKIINPFFCSFRSFGGTEKVINDVIVVEDTAIIETWFDTNITSDCILEIGAQKYEILGTPENINMLNKFYRIKIRAFKGDA